MNRLVGCLMLSFSMHAGAYAAVQEEPVSYNDGATVMKGFVVYDDAVKTKRPGIVVIHEWWGITPHVRDEARNLARQGYTAFVADMYGDGKTADTPKEAGALAGSVRKNPGAMLSRFTAARAALAGHATVDGNRIAATGFCFGGSVVLDMARAGVDLKGVVAFHASLGASATKAAQGKVKARVLVLNGEADPLVKPETIDAFQREMAEAKVDYRFVNYPDALHAYTNPDATAKGKQFKLPIAYHPQADKQAKAEAARFFATVLKR